MSKHNKTIQFLYEASKALPSNNLFTTIRSRMLAKCSEINASNSLKLNLIPRCDACGVVFKDVPPINFIKPVEKPKCYKKILNSTNNSKYKILSLKKFNKYKNEKQILITQCKLCKKQIKTLINKVGHTRVSQNPLGQQNTTNKKKKRKKNAEFSGLNKSAVLAVKRSLENENNNRSPKRRKTSIDTINLVSPTVNILTPNTIRCRSTPVNTSEVICLDSPKKKSKKKKKKTNNTIIEITDSEASTVSPQKNKTKKSKKLKNGAVQKIEHTPKIKNNNNVVLVAEQNTAEKKKKKLNNLSSFLKNSPNTQPTKTNSLLQNFLSSLT